MEQYRYKILEEIGKGSFGTVFKARRVRTDYAIKKVSRRQALQLTDYNPATNMKYQQTKVVKYGTSRLIMCVP